jgi:hypothetical protein
VSQARTTADHTWVVAALVDLPEPLAKQAFRRGTVRVPAEPRPQGPSVKIDVLDVYCGQCRRPWEDVHGKSCEAAASKDHLIGGPTGVRKKRDADDDADTDDGGCSATA